MTEERLKELIPGIKEYKTGITGVMEISHCDVQPVRDQTEKLRSAINCMIYVAEETGNRDLSDTVSGILGIPFSEIGKRDDE